MNARNQVSKAAIELIKRFEGYRPTAARLPDGGWTIGYGHTLTARAGAKVSERDAEALLIYDLIAVAHAVNERCFTPLTQNQFDALCAFVFNIGIEAFNGSSVLRRLNEGALIEAACAMELWRKSDFEGERIVVDALVRRRAVEKTLFLTPPGGWVPAPSAVLPPRLDINLTGAVPGQAASVLRAELEGDQIVVRRDQAPTPRPASPEGDEEASPVTVAAAAVAARLKSILPDDEPSEPATASEPAQATVQRISTLPLPKPPSAQPIRRAANAPLVLLAGAGLVFFGWALYWAFNAVPSADGDLLNPLAVSWVVGVVGIGCFGVAAYLMLERLGGGEAIEGSAD